MVPSDISDQARGVTTVPYRWQVDAAPPDVPPAPPSEPPTRNPWKRRILILALVTIGAILIFGGNALAHGFMHMAGGGCGGG